MNRYTLSQRITSLIVLALVAACRATPATRPVESPSPAPSLTILDAVTSRQVGGDYVPIDITSQFSPSDTFYCVLQVAQVEHETQIVARWHFGDTFISETTYTTEDEGSGYVAFELTSQQPWPKGIYRVDILSAGRVIESVEFSVTKESAD